MSERHIQLPRLGVLRLKDAARGYLPVGAKVSQATVREHAGHWYVSVLVESDLPEHTPSTMPVVGVDLGIKTLATLSNGVRVENPKTLQRFQRKLIRAQRKVSRRVKGSNRRQAAVKQLAQLHYRIANIRKDAIHKFTTQLTRESSVIALEDLHVAGLLANHHLARAVADVSFAEIRRQIEYKAAWRGVRVVMADRFYPSSKTCHVCGGINDRLTLTDREWTCECGAHHDRDVNAAMNLRTFAVSSTEKSNGRGAGSADAGTRADVTRSVPAMKRQPSTAELVSVG